MKKFSTPQESNTRCIREFGTRKKFPLFKGFAEGLYFSPTRSYAKGGKSMSVTGYGYA